MQFGHFDDQRKEYVIESPYTPRPWINYLGTEDFFSLISHTAGGYSFYRDAKLRRITRFRYNNVPEDNGGRLFYITDGADCWSPAFLPRKARLDRYECRHGLGYTTFLASKAGLEANLTCFVPLSTKAEVMMLTLTNTTGIPKDIRTVGAVEFCLWNAVDDSTNFQRNYSTGEVEIESGTIYHKTEYRERRNHYAFWHVNEVPTSFDSDRDTFLGKFNGFDTPQALDHEALENSVASGWSPIGAFENRFTLPPGDTKSLIYLLGYVENPDDEKWESAGIVNKQQAHALHARFATQAQVERALQELCTYWDKLLASFTVQSGDAKFDRMVNIWNQYQCMVTFNMSRSASYYESGIGRGMGFRDSCQDLLGFMHIIPERARERIIDIASIQFEDGSTYHQYQPLDKKGNADIGGGFNDDPLWLIACVYAYLAETNDFSILDERVPFNNDETKAKSLLEHLRCSVSYTTTHKGPHGLPLIGRADWNDCLNLNCFSKEPGESFQTFGPSEGPVAESVFIAGMYVKYGNEYADICEHRGLNEEAAQVRQNVAEMVDAIEDAGWDGEWFVRAFDAYGNPVGSHVCEEGKIFIEPQGMCVMAGVGVEDGKAQQAMDSVKKYLDSKYGIILLQPAYTKYHVELGEISSYPPGYKENAGIFCHNNPWIACAETVLGHGDRAMEIVRKISPIYLEDQGEVHRTEPYAFCQMVAGRDAATFGEGKNSWLTGTSAWTFALLSQYILGIQPTLDGLRIDPCIPKEYDGYTVERRYRGVMYHISIENPNHVEKGVVKMLVDGREVAGNLIPLPEGKSEVQVKVTMG